MTEVKTCDACKAVTDHWEPKVVDGVNLVICRDAVACRRRAENKGLWKS